MSARRPAPSPVVRHWTAFAIYLGAAAALTLDWACVLDFSNAPLTGEQVGWTALVFLIIFAISLLGLPIIALVPQFDLLLSIQSEFITALILEAAIIFSYAIWITLFHRICDAKTNTSFRLAVLALTLLAFGNLTACHHENVEKHNHPSRE